MLHPALRASYTYTNYIQQLPSQEFLNEFAPDSGAVGTNRRRLETGQGVVNVRTQEIGELLIARGLALGRDRDVINGVKVLSCGFSLQHADGSFPQAYAEEHSRAAASFYLCHASLALLMLQEQNSPEYQRVREEWLPKMLCAARYVAENDPEHPDLGNHLCVDAACIALVTSLSPAPELAAARDRLFELALTAQHRNGYWPERGGIDCCYQAVSLIYLLFAYAANPRVWETLPDALSRGFHWLGGIVAADGSIDCTHNTRKTPHKLPPDNEALYTGDLINIDYALRMWGDITGEVRWTALADKVRAWIKRTYPGVSGSSWDEKLAGT